VFASSSEKLLEHSQARPIIIVPIMMYLVGSALFLAAAIVVTLTGGFRTDVAHVRLSLQWPHGLCIAAWAMFVVADYRSATQAGVASAIMTMRRFVEHHATAIAVVIAIVGTLAGLMYGALVAAGADPYGYVSQSLLWARGNPVQFQTTLALQAPWPNAEWSFSPIGYRPSYISGIIVPIYSSGLPLQMAMLVSVLGLRGSFIAVPILGGLSVWATYRLALRISGSRTRALLSSLLTACSPIFLFELMQPMSDVPATAWWLVSLLAALEATSVGALGAGLSASIAILTRPNLLLLVLPLAAYVVFAVPFSVRQCLLRSLLFGAGLIPGVALTAAVNATFFGSPLKSGYGNFSDLYAIGNVARNLAQYPAWLYSTHSLIIFIGLGSGLLVATVNAMRGERHTPLVRHGLLGGAFATTLFASYVFYIPFDHWNYLRFLLPAIPLLLILGVEAIDNVTTAISARASRLAFAFVLFVLPLYYLSFAIHGEAFALKRLYVDRYVTAAKNIEKETPESALVIGVLQSGSVRMYGHRMTMRFDVVPPEWLERSFVFLREHGHVVYTALESAELPDFQTRFGAKRFDQGSKRVLIDPLGFVFLSGPYDTPQDGKRPSNLPKP
jgi:hypothetical protein